MNKLRFYDFLNISDASSDSEILKKIHFKRLKSKLPNYCVEFLIKKYNETNDIRFFNELLWIVDGDTKLIKSAVLNFTSNFINSEYNFAYDKSLLKVSDIDIKDFDKSEFLKNSIALIGNPFHFILPFYKFLINGKRVDIINVKYHPNLFFNKILNSSVISFFFKILFRKSYYEINILNKGDLKKITLHKKYDIGFHKLSFIIGKSIISCFNKGLINDHWGLLPLFKGKSTLQYSKLFGFPAVVTNHLISERIDSGKIVCFTPLRNSCQNLRIIFGLKNRIYKSVVLLSNNHFENIDNSKGLVFYKMHPWLQKKI